MPLPVPRLDDRTFEALAEELRKLIPVYAPSWTDHNLSDPGITLVDLLAWLAEMELYNLDFIGESHLLKYLRLLGLTPRPASAAGVELQLTSLSGEGLMVPGGTIFKTDSAVSALTFESDEDIEIIPLEIRKVVSYANYRMTDVTEFNNHPQAFYHAFGELPEAGNALYLGLDLKITPGDLAGKTLRLGVYPYEEDLPSPGRGLPGEEVEGLPVYPSADVTWELWLNDKEWWVPLKVSAADENVRVLSRQGVLAVVYDASVEGVPATFPQDLEQYVGLSWLRCRLERADYEIPPRIDRLLPNVVSAREGESREEVWESTGLPHQVFKTRNYPVVPGSQTVIIDGKDWQAVADFDASGPADLHYLVEFPQGEISFGNGINGAVPARGKKIAARYRSGGGLRGNIKAYTVKGSEVPGLTVTNPYPAHGGEEAESVQDTFIRLKRDLQVPYTAVTAEDYEYLARATPGLRVARARAVILHDNEVIVVVMPYSLLEKPLSAEPFKQAVCRYLERHRLMTTSIRVGDPDYVKISITGEIKVKHGYDPEQMKVRITEALNRFLSPLKRESLDNEWSFGRPVYHSEINEVLEGVEGVDGITALSLAASEGVFEKCGSNIEIGPLSVVFPGLHEIRIITPHMKCIDRNRGGNDR